MSTHPTTNSNKREASEMISAASSSVGKRSAISSRQRGTIHTLLSRPSPFENESGTLPIGEFPPNDESPSSANGSSSSSFGESEALKSLRGSKILVVGAGGLGCEILKDLGMLGGVVSEVVVIDLDTIDVTNLNRQFLFRQKDVGHSKADVAAKFINERCPWMKVVPYHGKIQDKCADFYRQFKVVISGLDNVEARRWLNGMINNLVEFDSDGDPIPETIIPLIDGGTEGFSGQSRLILPRITSCFECSLDSFAPTAAVPLCTIAETPRIPEHCIAYAYVLQFPKEFPDRKLDADSPNDMKWVYERALERAEKFGIGGVTYMLTLGVVKNIIPAVASTNAIVSAVCVNEAIKVLSFCSQSLNTYMMYMGSAGIYSHTFVYDQKETCPVCTTHTHRLSLQGSTTLNALLQKLCDGELRLKSPSVTSSTKTLYMRKPVALEKATRQNLDKPLKELFSSGEELTITDPVFHDTSLSVIVTFE
mmetsp:Transcript_10200/g.22535  ORF Transcript_10200/g.22535 Transcript_10200/m.22535 type:complete len:479 (+) Transcript_10200:146-1582(+)